MKTRTLIIIGTIIVLAGSSGVLFFSQHTEIECLRLYRDIRELSRTLEMQLAELHTIEAHKSLVFDYVEKRCPDFPDLKSMHDNYKQTKSEVATSYMDKIVPTLEDFRKFASDSPDIGTIFYRFGQPDALISAVEFISTCMI